MLECSSSNLREGRSIMEQVHPQCSWSLISFSLTRRILRRVDARRRDQFRITQGRGMWLRQLVMKTHSGRKCRDSSTLRNWSGRWRSRRVRRNWRRNDSVRRKRSCSGRSRKKSKRKSWLRNRNRRQRCRK
jgi:hypothetical protein